MCDTPHTPHKMSAYRQLYCVIKEEYLNGDPNNHAPTYAKIAWKFIMGVGLDEAIIKYSPSVTASAISMFLDNTTMECTCISPDHMSEDCFPCNVDKQAKKELKARHNLVRQGVIT